MGQESKRHAKDNVTSQESKALTSLWKRSDNVIKPADKGSATVIMSKEDYLTKVMGHLDIATFYEKLNDDPMERYSEEITSFLDHMKSGERIDDDTWNYL